MLLLCTSVYFNIIYNVYIYILKKIKPNYKNVISLYLDVITGM